VCWTGAQGLKVWGCGPRVQLSQVLKLWDERAGGLGFRVLGLR
jgi:hypothetical protein